MTRVCPALLPLLLLAPCGFAQWRVLSPTDGRTGLPGSVPPDATSAAPGDRWPEDRKFRWMVADLQIPDRVDGRPVDGQPIGLKFNCGDGGEVWFDGKLQARYDNDHPAMLLVSDSARPGQTVRVWGQVYGKIQGGDHFGEAAWALIDPARIREPLTLSFESPSTRPVPDGLVGLSQGGGMCDYDASTAAKLKEGGFKWFRMDNVFTTAAKRASTGELEFDWTDLDRRRDFMASVGAEPVFAVSYMPQAMDAVPDPERHSAPRSYPEWEEMCEQAARHCRERGKPVRFWEVWNEVNAGWLKPGPRDEGSADYQAIYRQATGREKSDAQLVRRFEAYCKLYRSTVRGVRRGDPEAQIGGPALASGPFDELPGVNGRGFARGLMLYCAREKLPLDFLSWHEYFQTWQVIDREVREFQKDAEQIAEIGQSARNLFVTEWNEAWWPDRPHDHEMGAAWCADGLVRILAPAGVKPCLFYAKQSDADFRGDWGILMQNNLPKPAFNMARVFNSMHGVWVRLKGGDDQVSGLAAYDADKSALRLVLVNFNERYDLRRTVILSRQSLPGALARGTWRRWTIDATHSNAFNDRSHADLEQTGSGRMSEGDPKQTLMPNSVTLLEFSTAPGAR